MLGVSIAIVEPRALMPPEREQGDGGTSGMWEVVLRQVAVRGVVRNLGLAIRLVAGEHPDVAQPARLQPRQEIAPALGRLGEAVGAPDRLAVAVLVHAYGDYDGDVLVGSAPAALQVDAVDVDVRTCVGQRPTPPLVGRFERLLVEARDRAGGDARAPNDLADVLDAARRRAGQVHLDDGLLHAGLPPFVALGDRDGEAHALELGHF